jgi:signal transduction histidine kinase
VLHGGASVIDLIAGAGPSAVTMRITADGRSIAPDDEARAARDGRQGLAEMRRLAAETGGVLEVVPGPGGGTVVSYRWPR